MGHVDNQEEPVPVSQTPRRGERRHVVSTKLAPSIIDRVDDFAESTDATRSAAIAALVEAGLGSPDGARELVMENHALRAKLSEARRALD